MKNNRGITLIALIITIIVMMILVAVTVSVVVNSDLIGTAQKAKADTETAYGDEANLSKVTIGGKEYASIEDYQAGIATVKAGVRATANMKYSAGTKTAVIPKGFTVSGISSEQTVDGGLVIYYIPEGTTISDWNADSNNNGCPDVRETYDQFVWIPVNNINDMYICQGKTASNGNCDIKVENGIAVCKNANHSTQTTPNKNTLMAGYLYTDDAMTTRVTAYTEGTGMREPDTVIYHDGMTDSDGKLVNLALIETVLDKTYTNEEEFKQDLQNEYNEIVKSVCINKGFYVGRYETTFQTDDGYNGKVIAGKENVHNAYLSGGYSFEGNWYDHYAASRNYTVNKTMTQTLGSTMIQGAAYDQMMKFVNTEEYNIFELGYRYLDRYPNLTGGLESLSSDPIPYTDFSKNIYDLSTMGMPWTTAAGEDYYNQWGDEYYGQRVVRAEQAMEPQGFAADIAFLEANYYMHSNLGSIFQLYIK